MTLIPRPGRRRELPPAAVALVASIRPGVLTRLIAAIEADKLAEMLPMECGQLPTHRLTESA